MTQQRDSVKQQTIEYGACKTARSPPNICQTEVAVTPPIYSVVRAKCSDDEHMLFGGKMIFIGGGSLLTQAVGYALKAGAKIDAVCVPIEDSSIPRLKKHNLFIIESNNPNTDVIGILGNLRDKKVFSINNKFILNNNFLESGPTFFNIHNGLVQNYRGIGEICIFSAICDAESEYGVTLHKILPNQNVDSGPVLSQIKFRIEPTDDFVDVMKKSLTACQKIFELNFDNIISDVYELHHVEILKPALSYNDVARICNEAKPGKIMQASNFGAFKAFFPKLVEGVHSARFI
jgi:hypothetical protein